MTVRRKPESEEFQIKFGGKSLSFGSALLILFLSSLPIADPIWERLGYRRDEAKTAAAIDKWEHRMAAVEGDVKEIKSKVASMDAKILIITAFVDGLKR